ncbi:MAG TPA: AtpZ/AtpI family protein [Methanotrichaceae archaeon]|nr:AtpZ/AtpI family protein [Methanotrichaceae archaeon]
MKIDNLNQALKAASAGIEMAISILIGSVLGYSVTNLLDEGSGYIGLTIGAILGLISGTYSLYRRYR